MLVNIRSRNKNKNDTANAAIRKSLVQIRSLHKLSGFYVAAHSEYDVSCGICENEFSEHVRIHAERKMILNISYAARAHASAISMQETTEMHIGEWDFRKY